MSLGSCETDVPLLLKNPYFLSGSVFAQQTTNFFTAFWAVLLFFRGEPLPQTALITLTDHISQEVLGAVFFVLAVVQMVWLKMGWKPIRYGTLGYLFLFAWWVGMVVLVAFTPPIRPLTLTCPVILATMSGIAFLTGRRQKVADAGAD